MWVGLGLGLGLGQRLRALDAAVGLLPPPRRPPPWSSAVGPLLVLREEVEAQRQASLVAGGWMVAVLLVLSSREPLLLVVGVGLAASGLLIGRLVKSDGLRWRAIELARPAPADVPLRRRRLGWAWLVGTAGAVGPLAVMVLVQRAIDGGVHVGRGVVALAGPLVIVAAALPTARRARERLAAWEREHGVRVLVPRAGRRSPARGGYYVTGDRE